MFGSETRVNTPILIDRVEAVRQAAKRLSRRQLLDGIDSFLAEADAARERGDLRGHRVAMACWNATWDELDRRDGTLVEVAS